MGEGAFSVSARVRRIAAHDPDGLPIWEYVRQLFFSSGVDLPDDAAYQRIIEEVTLEGIELPAGAKAVLSLQLALGLVIVLDPVTHAAQFIEGRGEPTRERQTLSLALTPAHAPAVTFTRLPVPLLAPIGN